MRARFSPLPVKKEKKCHSVLQLLFFSLSSQLVSLPPQHGLSTASVLTVNSQNNRNAHYGSNSSTCLFF